MKDKIIFLIIGVLIGAIITTCGFLIYNKSISNSQPEMTQMRGNGQFRQSSDDDMGEPPEKLDGDNGEEPPERPDGEDGMKSNRQKNNQDTTDSTSDSI